MQTGPEIGVASTKAYTAPLVDLYMLAILLAEMRGTIDAERRTELVRELRYLPALVGECLERPDQLEDALILVGLETVAGDEFGGDLGLVHGCLNRKIERVRKGLLWRISALSRALRGEPCRIGVCTSFRKRI
jgi:hypothetical protein